MEDKLFQRLDELNVNETKLLLDKDINLSIDSSTRKRIEKSIMKKTGYYNENNTIKNKMNEILGGIFMKRKIALALSTGLMLSLAGGGYAYAKTPVGYVSMDINPSVELGVNAFDKVVTVEAYNEDGEKILEGTDLINYDIENAVNEVISNAIAEGYIQEDGSSVIEITTSTDKEDVAVELEEVVQDAVDETLENNDVEADVETENVALARRDEARELGITPGKLNLIQKLQAFDPTITVEDYKNSSVKDIQKKTKELRKNNKVDETITDAVDNTDVVSDKNNEDTTSTEATTETSTDSVKKNDNSNNGNGSVKKEEKVNGNAKKEETTTSVTEENTTTVTPEKQNNSNSSKEEKTSDSDSGSKNSQSKSSDKGSDKSGSQGKSKNN